jgi:hypothetical protein
MIGDAPEHLPEVGLRIQAVQFRRGDSAVDRRGVLAAGVRPGEDVVLAPQRFSLSTLFNCGNQHAEPVLAEEPANNRPWPYQTCEIN